jgi:hypothetical protein
VAADFHANPQSTHPHPKLPLREIHSTVCDSSRTEFLENMLLHLNRMLTNHYIQLTFSV